MQKILKQIACFQKLKNNPMKKILFAIDFSLYTDHVFKFVHSLAAAFDAELLMLNVFGIHMRPNESPDFDQRTGIVIEKLKTFAKENIPDSSQVKINYLAKIGFPGDTILETSEEEDVDLIVMGTKGESDVLDLYFGGVSMTIMNKSQRPVLLIPPTAKFNGWSQFGCTTNFSFDDLLVINTLLKWSEKFNTVLNCLHVLEEDIDVAHSKVNILKDIFADRPIQFHIKSGSVKDVIEIFETEAHLGLLAMIHHHKSFAAHLIQGDLTKEVATELKVPLLVFNIS